MWANTQIAGYVQHFRYITARDETRDIKPHGIQQDLQKTAQFMQESVFN